MRVLMLSYMTLAAVAPATTGLELAPGAIHDFDEAEAERLIEVKGARLPTEDELAAADALAAAAAAGKKSAKAAPAS